MRVPTGKETSEDQLDKLFLSVTYFFIIKENIYAITAVVAYMFSLILTMNSILYGGNINFNDDEILYLLRHFLNFRLDIRGW